MKTMNLIPLNNHVLIEPLEHEGFMAETKNTYDEIGIVVEPVMGLAPNDMLTSLSKGDKVYFDSWLASKYPKGDNTFYWLIPFSSIKAYEPTPEK